MEEMDVSVYSITEACIISDIAQLRQPLIYAVWHGKLDVLRILVKELSVDVNQENSQGATALYLVTKLGLEAVVRCLVTELGADVNQAAMYGAPPLMTAAAGKHKMLTKFLIKHGADPQAVSHKLGTAVDVAQREGAPAHLIAYLKAKAHCANPGCSGAGLRKCTGCKRARYCGQQCQLAHWPAHKAECKQRAELKVGKGK
jgi:ankyrin repeat protein